MKINRVGTIRCIMLTHGIATLRTFSDGRTYGTRVKMVPNVVLTECPHDLLKDLQAIAGVRSVEFVQPPRKRRPYIAVHFNSRNSVARKSKKQL